MNRTTYLSLLSLARRRSRRADEAEDLLQTALLSAVEAGRADLSTPENRRWLAGTLRNRAAFDARSALRRRAREKSAAAPLPAQHTTAVPRAFVDALPPSLRSTALLALTGHTRAEITHLLRLSDPALRQRIAQIRARWRSAEGADAYPALALAGPFAFGLMRRALLRGMEKSDAFLGSHDPDGHLFVLNTTHKTTGHGNIPL